MTDLPRKPQIDIRKNYRSSDPFGEVRGFYGREIAALIELLLDESLKESFKHSIRKYLVVVIFAALDYFFRNAVRNLIDDNDLNVAPLFPPNSQVKLDKLAMEYATTKGSIVASTYRFVDIYEIDFVFSHLLQMDSFLDYLIKLNDINQTRYVLDGHPIPIEYEKLIKAYKLRNEIAHEIKTVKISKSRVIAIWDNFMNIMDLSQDVFISVSDTNHRRSLDSIYQSSKERAKRIATYKLCSDSIMSKLSERGQLTIVYDRNMKATEVVGNSNDKIMNENLYWVIPKMLRDELIEKNGKIINLTSKGENRFRRTTDLIREKWKRELSNITCSWITRI
jgi:hypothetical protein